MCVEAPVAQRALDAMAAALTVPAVPALIVVSVDEESKNVNDTLLLKTLTVPSGDANNSSSRSPSPSGNRTFRWWNGCVQRNQQPLSKKHRNKKPSSVVVNHQNNYVSVTVAENNEPTHLIHSDGRVSPSVVVGKTPAAASSSRQRRQQGRKFCWWILLFLLLITVACLAFVAVSLVSILRQGQGSSTCL